MLKRLDPAVNRCQLEREHEAPRYHQVTIVAKIAATIAAAPCAVLIQSIMPAGPRQLETGPSRMLPHQADDHAGASRGGRGGRRTPNEGGPLVPWAQEAERIGVSAGDRGILVQLAICAAASSW
jgi:hypothetical protein